MGLSEDVLRFLTVKVEAHEEGPSAMMQKRDATTAATAAASATATVARVASATVTVATVGDRDGAARRRRPWRSWPAPSARRR